MSNPGSIYWREGDKRWVAKYPMPPDYLTGAKRPPKYIYSSKPGRKGEQEVKRKLNSFVEKIEAGDFSEVYKMTVEGWLNKYMAVYCADLAKTTLEGYERYIKKHINPVIGKVKLNTIKPLHIQNLYNKLREAERGFDKNGNKIIGYSEKTILQIHRILNRAFL